ncbi:hypothetical protein ACTFIR_012798 [Dictyostelium discoideum]
MESITASRLSALMTCDKESGINFTFTGSGFALSSVKGVGAQVVESLIEEFKKCIQRSDTIKAIEILIEAGAFDRFSPYELISSVLYDQKERGRGSVTTNLPTSLSNNFKKISKYQLLKFYEISQDFKYKNMLSSQHFNSSLKKLENRELRDSEIEFKTVIESYPETSYSLESLISWNYQV